MHLVRTRNTSSAVAEMGAVATIDMGQKWGRVAVPFFLGIAGCPSNTKSPGLRPTSIPSGILILDASSRLATIKMGRKLGVLCPLFGEGSWVPIPI